MEKRKNNFGRVNIKFTDGLAMLTKCSREKGAPAMGGTRYEVPYIHYFSRTSPVSLQNSMMTVGTRMRPAAMR